MTEQHRDILSKHWYMLKTYINPTEDLMESLVSAKVLPTSMADDIRSVENREEKNELLLKSLKIIGSAAFRKFRQILLQNGYAFIAELLWDEDHSSFIEDCDFNSYPSFNNSLNPMERKQLIWLLDSKVKRRLLQSEWRNNSEERIKKLKAKIDREAVNTEDLQRTISRLNAELSSKNETLKNFVRDYNLLNDDVISFEKRHQLNARRLMTKSLGSGDNSNNSGEHTLEIVDTSNIQDSRFRFMDQGICEMDQQLSTLLGESEAKPFANMQDMLEKTERVKLLIRELEGTVDRQTNEQKQVQDLLYPDDPDVSSYTLLQTVNNFLSREQRRRVCLLEDVDNLSKKLRRITDEDSKSALKGLRQSAVTGNPPPEVVDYRFLRNHIALIMADADHLIKKMAWKEEELKTIRTELGIAQYRMTKVSSKPVLKPIRIS